MSEVVWIYTQEQAKYEWRKLNMPGRLYWKKNNRRWRNFFDSDDLCVWRDGAASLHFKSWKALQEFINYCHWVVSASPGGE